MRIPSVAPFPVPDRWVRPSFMPASPPPEPPEALPHGSGSQDGGKRGAAADCVDSSPSVAQTSTGKEDGDGMEAEDGSDVGNAGSEMVEQSSATRTAHGEEDAGSDDARPGAQEGVNEAIVASGRVAGEDVEDEGKVEQEKEVVQEKGGAEGKEGDPETTKEPEEQKDRAQKEADEEAQDDAAAAAAATAAAELAAKEKVEAEASKKAEAARKAEAEAKAAETAANEDEKRARRLRVTLVLNRLREAADGGPGTGRRKPSRNQFSRAAIGAGSAGRRAGGAIIAVPRLRDHEKNRPKGGVNGVGGAADGPGDASSAGGAAVADESAHWPPLGQRRLKRRLDCSRRFAVLARSPGPGLRFRTLLRQDTPEVKAAPGGWLEAKLARMRKVEDGEWRAWQRRVADEETSTPGEAAGAPLPFGFIPRLAHRALAAYALVRTLSKPLRLTPASSVAFLRALALKLRTPLLDAIHCELLRRVCCMLKGRAGGWAKGSSAQRELDWKYLDQVRGFTARTGTF